ncbi:MAG: hypothetical protein HYU39_05505 [Thaumarchaeota archaeon]|nr:hypothetical protein [Nitrososphaerota archaeon]
MILQITDILPNWVFIILILAVSTIAAYYTYYALRLQQSEQQKKPQSGPPPESIPSDLFYALGVIILILTFISFGASLPILSRIAALLSSIESYIAILSSLSGIVIGIASGIAWFYIARMAKQHNELLKLLKPKE